MSAMVAPSRRHAYKNMYTLHYTTVYVQAKEDEYISSGWRDWCARALIKRLSFGD